MTGSRASLSLDGEWAFVRDPRRTCRVDTLPPGEPIRVPGCWEAQIDEPYGIVTAWYRRSFDVPGEWVEGRVVLRFGAVMYACEVYVNGQVVGSHEGGYTPFEIEVGPALHAGLRNEIAVRVTNPVNVVADYPVFPEADLAPFDRALAELAGAALPSLGEIPHGKQTWYSSQSGIWQSVSLDRRPASALGALHVRPDVPGSRVVIGWSLDAGREQDLPDGIVVRFEVVDPDGAVAAKGTATAADGVGGGECVLGLRDVQLWDIGVPRLYQVRAQLIAPEGTKLDEVTTRFGMREIRAEAGRILLNGRPIYVLGVLDQDLYPDTIANPPSRDFLDRQMRLVREMGFNLLRCHIKVPDPAYLDAADEAGLLVWCELPNWLRFGTRAADRGRETLREMVTSLGNHPSIVAWTIINEDWGTRVRDESRDRRWLSATYDWLKALDPTRLVIDNSACETGSMPNFHVRSDLADFHLYFGAPDHALRWRERIEDFAHRPPWLWSPYGDAVAAGDEPLVLSEFGSWGLPRPDDRWAAAPPWWHGTGQGHFRPEGWTDRFRDLGLHRIWPTVGDLAEATQRHQFETLQYEIGDLRRHDSIQGYVVTELCDANWEANGVLDERRSPKVFHGELSSINAPETVVADLERRDVRGGERVAADVLLSSFGDRSPGGTLSWWLELDGSAHATSSAAFDVWPKAGAANIGPLEIVIPPAKTAVEATLHLRVVDAEDRVRASNAYRLAVIPERRGDGRQAVAIDDPGGLYPLERRVLDLGHRVVRPNEASIIVTTELGSDLLETINRGARALLLVRSRDAIASDVALARPVRIHPRWLRHPEWPGSRSPWDGDWVTSWSWIDRGVMPGLPPGNPLGFAYEEVMPDHVLTGYDPQLHTDEVPAGMFSGWIHAPAALIWTFPQGEGWLTVTTMRVAPESGPVADVLLDGLIELTRNARAAPSDSRAVAIGAQG
jgi:hypothetical protein